MAKILHISRTMGQGGAEKIVLQLCEETKSKFAQVFVASSGGEFVADLDKQGISHVLIDDIENKSFAVLYKNYSTLRDILKTNNIEIIHVHHRMGLFYAQLLRLYFQQIKIIYTAHNIFNNNSFLYKILLRNVTCVAVGSDVKENIPIRDKNQIRIIFNGVREFEHTYEPTELNSFAGTKILCIARLSEQKGQKFLISAIKELKKDLNSDAIKLFLLGEGEDQESLENLVAKYQLNDDVRFLGFQKNVNNFIKDCDFVVLPSLWEGFPLTPIEVFLNGKTIIATNINGTREIVNDDNGMLVEPSDVSSLKEAIKFLIENPSIKKNKEIKALNDYKHNFSYDHFIAQYLNIYSEVL